MSIESDIVRIGEQEKALRFERFDLGAAWSVGQHIYGVAAAAGHILSIDVQINGMQAFFAAMPGARPDFEHWIRRKRNIALRFLRSSYGVGLELVQQKTTLEEKWGLPTADYASHGGSVPILVEGVGCIGAVTVSGLPQRDDHNVVIEALAVHRGLDPQRLRHP
ncbi:heme-degrading domain-containing protein [Allorhizobium pseudoryzae]|uniref:heme-degrading domain-containing protein n=1 Tax=Allorhizobium pseudoryzae TaxID=379684 RepID=UPI003CFDA182